MSSKKNVLMTLGVAVAGSLLAFGTLGPTPVPLVLAKEAQDNSEDNDGPSDARRKWNFIADIVDKAGPAVVHIEIQGRYNVTVSNGSGFIVRPDGLILTNAHVVGNNSSVLVRLHDGTILKGIVQAIDPVSDLATVRVSANNLPTLKLGDSSRLRTGEWVIALGSPFKLSKTATVGIVSSAERGSSELGLYNKDINYIQTDANINFGNSGGPLVNLDGEAIGINTLMVTTGISFAIPSNYAANFLTRADKVEGRSANKGWFGDRSQPARSRRFVGITMLSLTNDVIRTLKARLPDFPDVDHGVLVHRVVAGSPAHRAGLRKGDVITRINEKEVRLSSDIYGMIAADEELRFTIHRGPDTLIISVIPEAVE